MRKYNLRKNEFETMLMVGIASHRLALLRDTEDRDFFYSSTMHDPEDKGKLHLLELYEDYFIIRSDLIFDGCVQRFFYVTKDRFEYNEGNLKRSLKILHKAEHKAYEILSKLNLRGFYTKTDFLNRFVNQIPHIELIGDTVKDRKSGKTIMTVKDDSIHFVYKEGNSESYMDLVKKDFNERVLQQCIELLSTSLKVEGA